MRSAASAGINPHSASASASAASASSQDWSSARESNTPRIARVPKKSPSRVQSNVVGMYNLRCRDEGRP
jgi:hypothetical protein